MPPLKKKIKKRKKKKKAPYEGFKDDNATQREPDSISLALHAVSFSKCVLVVSVKI